MAVTEKKVAEVEARMRMLRVRQERLKMAWITGHSAVRPLCHHMGRVRPS